MAWHATGIPAGTSDPATMRPAMVAGQAIVLIRVDDAWHALDDRCSHAGCPFSEDGEVIGDRLVCDCHGSEFDIRSGRPVRPPATSRVAVYPVRIVAGHLEVER